jgi:hypothetical protein
MAGEGMEREHRRRIVEARMRGKDGWREVSRVKGGYGRTISIGADTLEEMGIDIRKRLQGRWVVERTPSGIQILTLQIRERPGDGGAGEKTAEGSGGTGHVAGSAGGESLAKGASAHVFPHGPLAGVNGRGTRTRTPRRP